jgi:hypothetical protein
MFSRQNKTNRVNGSGSFPGHDAPAAQGLAQILLWLWENVGLGPVPANEWDLAHARLEGLLLSTEEFGLAKNRLNNARAFSEDGEAGAARFELKLLGQLLER